MEIATEVGELSKTMVEEAISRLSIVRYGLVQDDAGEHLLFADVIGNGQHCDLLDLRMSLEGGLDLGGGDVFAGSPDDILLPIDEMERPVGILPNSVPPCETNRFARPARSLRRRPDIRKRNRGAALSANA